MHLPRAPWLRRASGPSRGLWGLVGGLVVVLVTSGAVAGLPVTASSTGAPTSSPTPASNLTFNPTCAYVSGTVCVSLYSSNEPNIVPGPGQTSSSVEPAVTDALPLVVKSMTPINWTGSNPNGVDSPVAINVSGTLWNGDDYYSAASGTTWHSATQEYYLGPLSGVTNKTYPWWYLVNITSGAGGDFFPGMTITWWIALTYNNSGIFSHVVGPAYTFTYSGAWPYSPDPGAGQYAGASAFGQDVEVDVTPAAPNWNDSLHLRLQTTAADREPGATIGSAWLAVNESLPNGTVVQTAKYQFLAGTNVTAGNTTLNFTIPASFALDPGAFVRYQVGATDFHGDAIVSSVRSYTVGGNGTFVTGTFGDDLALYSTPNVAANPGTGNVSTVQPGTAVDFTLASTTATTAINAAEVTYTVDLPANGASATSTSWFHRFNSTTFLGGIPALPAGAAVTFSISAWDFASTLEVSPTWNYSVESPGTMFGQLPTNQTFFYVGVYDAGAGAWVSGARVSIEALGGYVHSVGTTTDGLAYPNATGAPYVPIVLPAGATYLVNVTPPASLGVALSRGVAVRLSVPHVLDVHSVVAADKSYAVIEEGDLLLFYLNDTAPAPVNPGTASSALVVATALGLVAAAVLVIPLYAWWRRIVARREAEVKRVTL